MFIFSIRIWGIFAIFLQVFESSSYILRLPQQHSNQHRKHTPAPPASPLPTWIGWNWKTAPSLKSEPEKVERRRSDWTWGDSADLNSEVVQGKTINVQVLNDASNGDIRQPQWPHDEFNYNSFTFQHQKRQHHDVNVNQLHVHKLNQFPPRPQEYVWKDLKPLTQKTTMHHYAPGHHYYAHSHSRLPAHVTISGNLESEVSASSPNKNLAATTTGHDVLSHGVSLAYGKQPITVVDTSRKYGFHHDNSLKHYYYYPPSDYKRKRYRLEIHPGFIAAPIAGLAAFGVAHAFHSKPVLLELGLVDKKRQHGHHEHHPSHPLPIPNPQPVLPKPEILPYPLPHPHPHPQPQPHPHPHSEYSESAHSDPSTLIYNPNYPALRPIDKPTYASEAESKPWWSPFAAMIPRLRNDIERD